MQKIKVLQEKFKESQKQYDQVKAEKVAETENVRKEITVLSEDHRDLINNDKTLDTRLANYRKYLELMESSISMAASNLDHTESINSNFIY